MATTAPTTTPPKKHHPIRKILGAILAGLIAIMVIAVATTPSPKTNNQVQTNTPAQTSPAAPTPAAPSTQAPAASQPTGSQQQALQSAQSYLAMGTGFSRAGLIQQLSSSAGEGFSMTDAMWAVDHSGANWNQQAVESAKGYLAMGTGFSRADLYQQLTSSAGEQFTPAQAEYALSQVYP